MNRVSVKLSNWMGFVLLILLTNAGSVCLAAGSETTGPDQFPHECPIGDMEDPTSETESENDKESDDDNLFDDRSADSFSLILEKTTSSAWDLIHDDPCHNLKSPPPKF